MGMLDVDGLEDPEDRRGDRQGLIPPVVYTISQISFSLCACPRSKALSFRWLTYPTADVCTICQMSFSRCGFVHPDRDAAYGDAFALVGFMTVVFLTFGKRRVVCRLTSCIVYCILKSGRPRVESARVSIAFDMAVLIKAN